MSKAASAPRLLSGYALESQFRKLRPRWCFTPLEHYVFSELIALCNEEGWPAEFSATNATLVAGIGCSEKGLISARKRLVAASLIVFIEGQNRRPTSYRFCLDIPLPEVSISGSKHLPQALPEVSIEGNQEAKHLPEHLPQALPEVSPYKEQTKTKTIMLTEGEQVSAQDDSESATPTTPTPALEQPTNCPKKSTEGGPDFASFWQAYGNKKGRHKSELKWRALTPAERVAALAAVPTYVARTPTLQYRKHPLSWLSGKHWEDEEATEQPAVVGQVAATAPTTTSFDPDALFGYTQSAAAGLAGNQDTPEYRAFLAREAAKVNTTP